MKIRLLVAILIFLNTNQIICQNKKSDIYIPNPNYTKYVNQNAICINNIDSNAILDFKKLEEILRDKKIILLGESGHGVREFNENKFLLVKYLIENMGFNIIGFESPIDRCAWVNFSKKTLDSLEILKKSLYGIWHTKDNLKLTSYIKNNNIEFFGFDPQFDKTSSRFFNYYLKLDYLTPTQTKILSNNDSIIYGLITSKRGQNLFSSNELFKEFKKNILNSYIPIIDSLKNLHEVKSSKELFILLHTIENRVAYIEKTFLNNIFSNLSRDSIMASNIEWYNKYMYPDRKIIIWAHNAHIMKEVMDDRVFKDSYMGNLLFQNYKDKLYSLGFYMYQGKINLNNRDSFNVVKNSKISLENILHQVNCEKFILDISKAKKNRRNNWLFKKTPTLHTGGLNVEKLVIKKCYDGIYFIQNVSLNNYL